MPSDLHTLCPPAGGRTGPGEAPTKRKRNQNTNRPQNRGGEREERERERGERRNERRQPTHPNRTPQALGDVERAFVPADPLHFGGVLMGNSGLLHKLAYTVVCFLLRRQVRVPVQICGPIHPILHKGKSRKVPVIVQTIFVEEPSA